LDSQDFWFDLPGNHDRLDVLAIRLLAIHFSQPAYCLKRAQITKSYGNYYQKHAVQQAFGYTTRISAPNRDIIVTSIDGSKIYTKIQYKRLACIYCFSL
jgi:hypothetical protein